MIFEKNVRSNSKRAPFLSCKEVLPLCLQECKVSNVFCHFGFLSGSLLLSSKNFHLYFIALNKQSFCNNVYIYCIFKILQLVRTQEKQLLCSWSHMERCHPERCHPDSPTRKDNCPLMLTWWSWKPLQGRWYLQSHPSKTVVFVGRSVSKDWWGNMECTTWNNFTACCSLRGAWEKEQSFASLHCTFTSPSAQPCFLSCLGDVETRSIT